MPKTLTAVYARRRERYGHGVYDRQRLIPWFAIHAWGGSDECRDRYCSCHRGQRHHRWYRSKCCMRFARFLALCRYRVAGESEFGAGHRQANCRRRADQPRADKAVSRTGSSGPLYGSDIRRNIREANPYRRLFLVVGVRSRSVARCLRRNVVGARPCQTIAGSAFCSTWRSCCSSAPEYCRWRAAAIRSRNGQGAARS